MGSSDDIRSMYESGMSTHQLAEQLGVSQMTVRRWMKRYGIPTRPVSQNRGPTPKGGHHDHGAAIALSMQKSKVVGKGNLGKRGPDAPNWKGGQRIAPNGRVSIWDPDKRRYIPRAVLIWESLHGPVGRGYVIHHRNADPEDDREENLIRLSNSEHLRVHRRHDREYIEKLQEIITGLGGEYPPYHDET